ncbi:MAG: phenylacetic acid degradation operon negative regulatory protein PaaX, partial [Pseudomonadota bacterium]
MTNPIESLLGSWRQRRPIRAGSLIISIFGDTVSAHGGSIWLGSLIEAVEPFGINERLVRTSVYRLVQDDWLSVEKQGRRSYYRFSEYGQREYRRAARRIYAASHPFWNGRWTLVIPLELTEGEREDFRKSLMWQGFGQIKPGVFAHPNDDRRSLDELLADMALTDKVIVLDAQSPETQTQQSLHEFVQNLWSLEELEGRYQKFLQNFQPILQHAETAEITPVQAFLVRTLLIHEYRRALLHDPDIPELLLPADWPGTKALRLTTN